jgi:TetR/AcrR family transcriptional regulator, cholesterol catabolism regulator
VDVKERILTGAEELFLQYGFRSISMDDIARHLGVSKKTIYQIFEDKDEIVCEVATRHFNREKELCRERIFDQAENPVHELLQVSRHIKTSTANVNPAVMFDLQKYHPKAWQIFKEFKQGFILETLKRNLNEGIKEGLYRPEINVEVIARLRLEQVQLAFDANAFPPTEFNFFDIQLEFLDHFIRGIVTEKGLQLLTEYKTKEHYHAQ